MTALIILKGRVQGVGCRYYTGKVASALRLSGSATNLQDGTVRVLLNTDSHEKVNEFIIALKTDRFSYHFWGHFTDIEFKGFENIPISGDYKWR